MTLLVPAALLRTPILGKRSPLLGGDTREYEDDRDEEKHRFEAVEIPELGVEQAELSDPDGRQLREQEDTEADDARPNGGEAHPHAMLRSMGEIRGKGAISFRLSCRTTRMGASRSHRFRRGARCAVP
jgi:hypothetical protein